jgi:hypothetical protein
MRTRSASTTEKCPDQSDRLPRRFARRVPTPADDGIGRRNNTIPQASGRLALRAISPKSLSNVTIIRLSRAAHRKTSVSGIPGATSPIQTTSCPARTRASTAAPGKFSSARKRMLRRGENLLRMQQIARVAQASRDVFPRQAGIICKNIGLVPAIGHQANDKLDRQPRTANNRLSGQNGRVKYDMIMRRCHDSSYQTAAPAPIGFRHSPRALPWAICFAADGASFRVVNPNATASCGYGTSLSI